MMLPTIAWTRSPNFSSRQHDGSMMALTQSRLREVINYNPDSGVFTWRRNMPPRGKMGDRAGCLVEKRPGCFYLKIGIDGKSYYAHSLAWLYVYGEQPPEIDHADGDGSNNSINNLRACTRTQNNGNRRIDRRNTTGLKGVFWFSQTKRWHAKITFDGRQIHLGYFDNQADAKAAYDAKARELFGVFARSA